MPGNLKYAVLSILLLGCTNRDSRSQPDYRSPATREVQTDLLERWNLTPYDESEDDFPRSAAFDSLFEPVGLFHIPEQVLVGRLDAVDVNDTGDLLLVDRIARAAILVTADGAEARALDPTDCHPGYQFFVMSAVFDPMGRILVVSDTRPAGLYFNQAGDCLNPINFGGPTPWAVVGRDTTQIALEVTSLRTMIYELNSRNHKRTLFETTDFARLRARHRTENEMVSTGHDGVAMTGPGSPYVTLIDVSSGTVRTIGEPPPGFRAFERDVRSGLSDSREIMADIGAITEGKSITLGLYALTDSLLIVKYRNPNVTSQSDRSAQLQVLKTDGSIVSSGDLFLRAFNFKILGARHGFLFRRGSTYRTNDPESNRPIIVYRWRDGI